MHRRSSDAAFNHTGLSIACCNDVHTELKPALNDYKLITMESPTCLGDGDLEERNNLSHLDDQAFAYQHTKKN